MARIVFLLRLVLRWIAVVLLRPFLGHRDRRCHYDRPSAWKPEQGLDAFLETWLADQGLDNKAKEVAAFFDFWLPRQAFKLFDEALIEFSVTTNAPGLGLMIFGDNRTINGSFGRFCREIGIYTPTVDLCLAICETFRPSDLAFIRVEFQPQGQTRYSTGGCYLLNLLRGHGGFEEKLALLPARFRDEGLAERIRTFSSSLTPDFYPLFFGLSFLGDGALESKMYLVRFDHGGSPLQPGSSAWRLVESMGVAADEMARLRLLGDRLWAGSPDGMTQIAIEVPDAPQPPKRVNVIYCGTRTAAIKEALEEAGYADETRRAVEDFERRMESDFVKFIGLRVGPEGLTPRVKLYGQALFELETWRSVAG